MEDTPPTVYAMYLRKSEMDVKWQQKNPDGEDPLARHERKLRRLVKANNGIVGEVFADPDISASKEDVPRPDFERMLVELPKFGGLLAMDIDRISRNSPKLEALIRVFKANPHLKFLVPDRERNPDLTTPEGQNEARELVISANKEALQIARRAREMHEDLREMAQPHTGVSGFGMANRSEADPRQSAMIAQGARDILAGICTNTIAKEWNKAGVTTPRGKQWSGNQITKMYRSPRMAGFRVSKNDRYRLEDTGQWAMCGPVFISEATWEAVVAELDRRAEAKTPRRASGKFLLSGFAVCGVCGGPLRGNVKPEPGRYAYNCRAGCVGIAGHRVDAFVERVLLKRWADVASTPVKVGEWTGADELHRLEKLNQDLMEMVRNGDMDIADVMPTVSANRKAIGELQASERAYVKREAQRAAVADPIAEWKRYRAAGDYERMLAAVKREILHIVIQPSGRYGRQWNEARVGITWVD
jgi:site-specific DNA recombinase